MAHDPRFYEAFHRFPPGGGIALLAESLWFVWSHLNRRVRRKKPRAAVRDRIISRTSVVLAKGLESGSIDVYRPNKGKSRRKMSAEHESGPTAAKQEIAPAKESWSDGGGPWRRGYNHDCRVEAVRRGLAKPLVPNTDGTIGWASARKTSFPYVKDFDRWPA